VSNERHPGTLLPCERAADLPTVRTKRFLFKRRKYGGELRVLCDTILDTFQCPAVHYPSYSRLVVALLRPRPPRRGVCSLFALPPAGRDLFALAPLARYSSALALGGEGSARSRPPAVRNLSILSPPRRGIASPSPSAARDLFALALSGEVFLRPRPGPSAERDCFALALRGEGLLRPRPPRPGNVSPSPSVVRGFFALALRVAAPATSPRPTHSAPGLL